jgi:hypothetical protein
LSKFAPYFQKSAERNHSNYRRSGNRKSTIIDGLLAKGFVVTLKSREVTLEAKKQGIEQLFLEKPLLFSELLLEGRKNNL